MSTAAESEPPEAPGSTAGERVRSVLVRELQTVARTRTFLGLGVVLVVVFLGLAWVGGGARAGYVPTIVDLVTPIELLVPVVAIAFGYRAILADRARGELAVLETYPLRPRELVAGVFAGRAVGLLAAVIVPLGYVGALTAVAGEEPHANYASHAGADSPLLFVRFVAVTALFAVVVLAIAIAISALANATRSVLSISVVALVTLLVGLDLALIYGLEAGFVAEAQLAETLAISPLSAYRGLVFETIVVTAAGTGPQTAAPLASLLGLISWGGGSLAVAIWAIGR